MHKIKLVFNFEEENNRTKKINVFSKKKTFLIISSVFYSCKKLFKLLRS